MGRPPLGNSGRTVTGSTKITLTERDELVTRNGTVHRGMRKALDLYLNTYGGIRPALADAARQSRELPDEAGTSHSQATLTTLCSPIHRGMAETRRWLDKGMTYVERTCSDCGLVVVRPA